jgi:DMSO/TMAO reductase YedYZ molybdopterin-dependent catalytic subunit
LKKPTNVREIAAARSRRAFLTMGIGAAAALGGVALVRSGAEEDKRAGLLRKVLRGNEKVAEAYFSDGHLAPTFDPPPAGTETRANGDEGLGDDFDPETWVLNLEGAHGVEARQITLAQIRELPRVEQTTQLNCVEGWTEVVHWAGARMADFAAKYAPQARQTKYIGMETPDKGYFVGLDTASALHPQTLLCYEMNGAELTSEHGAPLRLVIPVKYGIKNIKRIGKITYTDERPADYWAKEGYDWYAGL